MHMTVGLRAVKLGVFVESRSYRLEELGSLGIASFCLKIASINSWGSLADQVQVAVGRPRCQQDRRSLRLVYVNPRRTAYYTTGLETVNLLCGREIASLIRLRAQEWF